VKGLPATFLVLAAVSCLGLPGPSSRACAAPKGTFTFTWNAPEACPSRERVQMEIARLLGGAIEIAHEDDLDVRASVTHGIGWSVVLTTRVSGQLGRRSIEAPSCESVAEATALIVALMIDPDAVAAQAQGPKGRRVPAPSPRAAAVARPLGVVAGLHAQGRLATLPNVDLGMGVGLGLVGRRWLLDLRGTYGLRRDQLAYLSSRSGAYGRFNISTGALAACLNLGSTALAFGPCAVAEAGWVSAEGYGTTQGFSRHAPWAALGAGGYLWFAVGHHLLLVLQADALVPIWRPEYVFRNLPGVVFRAPAVGGRFLAGIAWRF
jgi:hypothetical protein